MSKTPSRPKLGYRETFAFLWLCIASTIGCARFDVRDSQLSVVQASDANGVYTWAIVPASYNPQNQTPWVIYNHGFGEPINLLLENAPEYGFIRSLSAAGLVVVASQYRDLACWGDEACAEDIANLQTLWRTRLNLMPQPFVIGESMGGIVTWNAISHGTLKPLAVVGIYPVCNLAAMYTNDVFVPTIQTAYDFTSPAGYAAATKGFDPILTQPSTYTGFPIQMWASHSDHVVLRSQNEDPFAKAINAAGGSVVIHTSSGEHGDPSNFDASAVIAFFSARLAGQP